VRNVKFAGSAVEAPVVHMAYWRTQHVGTIPVRMVDYTAGYIADHWCSKGHIRLCLEGELHTELEDGRKCKNALIIFWKNKA